MPDIDRIASGMSMLKENGDHLLIDEHSVLPSTAHQPLKGCPSDAAPRGGSISTEETWQDGRAGSICPERDGELHCKRPGDVASAFDKRILLNETPSGLGEVESSLGVRWAPLSISPRRRFQTLVVLYHTVSIAIFLTAFFFSCAIPLFWPLLLPYLIYISLFSKVATDGSLRRRSRFLRSLRIWTYFAGYFPAKLHRSEVLSPTRKYIFGYHPHGIISHGAFAAFATEALGFSELFPGITNTLLTLDSNFRLPFYRDYALAMGLGSVSRESCENLLSRGGADGEGMGRAITIVVGGARESLDAQPHMIRLVLKRRKGFIKLAIRTGADLVPVLAFGENELYKQVASDQHPLIHKFQLLVKRTMGFTIPLFHARGVFNYDVGLMPYRRPLNIVVGRPIQVMQERNKNNIEDAYVDELHARYVAGLQKLWEEWKDTFATERASELEIN
ncbi:diacylglycerol O-acyltransferase 1 [Coccidioides posadasii str. Silveira]|uniref:Diacylglycerol O-acyltransferase n=3 Tax=Coccidioides posadasii TaxID=199306 RepID=E9DGY4_COCPS|nr:Diacylglycerol acyltransferase family protein [Coccidioides posadasii C735 delta SOWgp]EER26004.1 Diacylglycerol acyltransferase family protein [Coccidioides posadasii C735 delta SOWgp]EFW14495.1 diacylglycerol acyltransferase [Coccidioides posadasii str. Silveira]KMM69746.1 diacylglycerol O-acyltransferase 1 [Coccidioides posadasii RMSCC 3488]QVM13734.1 diacylglycerol O-acyltransferase 1 [Coccidioides posadasii str. Silveira]|eukprot:XP_003068149.1 Diacylglycerol acyltransferase family protein [Coccidioides posadasii C735 delta SOWgp]